MKISNSIEVFDTYFVFNGYTVIAFIISACIVSQCR